VLFWIGVELSYGSEGLFQGCFEGVQDNERGNCSIVSETEITERKKEKVAPIYLKRSWRDLFLVYFIFLKTIPLY